MYMKLGLRVFPPLYSQMLQFPSFFTDAGLEVKVKDPPKGMIPPGTQLVKPKTEPQPNKVRGE